MVSTIHIKSGQTALLTVLSPQVEDENEALVGDLDEERRRAAALARSWAGELEALPGLPRERWPAAVRRLVDGLERDSTAAGQAQAQPADRLVFEHMRMREWDV